MNEFVETPFEMILMISALIYVGIIFLRGALTVSEHFGLSGNRSAVITVAVILVIIVFSGANGIGWGAAIASLLTLSIGLSFLSFVYGGMAVAGLLRQKGIGAVGGILLFISELALGFIDPLFSAPLCIAILALNYYLEYQDIYSLVREKFIDNEWLSGIFIYPPMILLITLFSAVFIPEMSSQWFSALVAISGTLVGLGAVYFNLVK